MWASTGLSWAFTGCSPKCLDPGGLHVLDALLKGLFPPLTVALLLSLPHDPSPGQASTQGFCEPQHYGHCCFCIISLCHRDLSVGLAAGLCLFPCTAGPCWLLPGFSPCFLLCPTLSQL